MKILVIAKADSIHTVRWIKQISEMQWEIIVYPSDRKYFYSRELDGFIKQNRIFRFLIRKIHNPKAKIGLTLCLNAILKFIFSENFEVVFLRKLIEREKPDVIHSLETQSAGYLLLDYLKRYPGSNLEQRWWHTNWGSDIYLFGRLSEHKSRISEVLSRCSYYSCEADRDILLAKKFGFKGTSFPVYPNTGGLDITLLSALRKDMKKPSLRNIIMVKGYQGWAGRCLVALRALARCQEILPGYKILIFSNSGSEDVVTAASLLSEDAGIEIEFVPTNSSHEQMLRLFGKARIYIGLSISDSISTSAVEAMSMGCFPIQSNTSTLDEWIQDGKSGFLVPPEDPEDVETAIRAAIHNPILLDEAEVINWEIIRSRLDYHELQKLTINSYLRIFNDLNGKSFQ